MLAVAPTATFMALAPISPAEVRVKLPPPTLKVPPPDILPEKLLFGWIALVPPTMRVLALRLTEPAPLSDPKVALAKVVTIPPLATVTSACVPRAAGSKVSTVLVAPTLRAVPSTRLVAGLKRATAPVPETLIVLAVPPSLTAPSVRNPVPVPLLVTLNVTAPLTLVGPTLTL